MKSETSEIVQSHDSEALYDLWFRAKVQDALDYSGPGIPHEQVMNEIEALIQAKLSTHQ